MALGSPAVYGAAARGIEKRLRARAGEQRFVVTEMDEVYNRGTYLEKRRLLMQRWADYLDGKPKGDIDSARPRLRVV